MKIGDKVKCLTSAFIIPSKGDIGEVIGMEEIWAAIHFPKYKKYIWLQQSEVEVVE